ncbi:MAG: EamA family transporter RarD [Pseudomonas sp.]|uniref:EamA family transporter RarD n=1 Tax=Pseudomonas sp. TaxID=306 RepID=UPI00339A1E73
MPPSRLVARALALNISAYLLWASATLLFKYLGHLPVWQVFAQRVVWSLLFCGLLLLLYRGRAAFSELYQLLRVPAHWLWLPLSSLLIASNWLLVIWAVDVGRLQEASLGYYLAPLFSLLLGKQLFQEPWRAGEPLSIGLCLLGAGLIALAGGLQQLPWAGLAIALTFAGYSALKKKLGLPPLAGLSLETLLAALPAAVYLASLDPTASDALGLPEYGVLVAIGAVTTLPMLFYVMSLRHLPLTTVSQLQYLNPSLMFILAVVLFKEPLSPLKMAGFGLIWGTLLWQQLGPLHTSAGVEKSSHSEH